MMEIVPNIEIKHQSFWKLNVSRAFSCWGDRMWSFGCGILIYKLGDTENLRLISIYGFVLSASVIFFASSVGSWIDSRNRLRVARIMLVFQNGSIAIASVILATASLYLVNSTLTYTIVCLIVIALCVVSTLSSLGSKIAMERDWIVVVSAGDTSNLAKLNSIFRTIDLLCFVAAPTLIGLLFNFTSNIFTGLFIGVWNVISMFIEFILLKLVYEEFPSLSIKNIIEEPNRISACINVPRLKINQWINGWVIYLKHSVMPAGLSLAFLYMTVLGFDNITWGFCLSQCVPEWVLGILVAFSAIIGVSGSLLFPWVRNHLGLERSGVLGISFLLVSLIPCLVSVFLSGSPFRVSSNHTKFYQNETLDLNSIACDDDYQRSYISVGVLLVGIVSARFGLWIFDLSVSQIMQENISEDIRGTMGGIQGSFNELLNVLKYALVIILPSPSDFGYLIFLSFLFICLAWSLFNYFIYFCSKVNQENNVDNDLTKVEHDAMTHPGQQESEPKQTKLGQEAKDINLVDKAPN